MRKDCSMKLNNSYISNLLCDLKLLIQINANIYCFYIYTQYNSIFGSIHFSIQIEQLFGWLLSAILLFFPRQSKFIIL